MGKQKEINITDSIQPKVAYKGSVEVIYIDKNNNSKRIKKHNNATLELFTGLTRFLAGLKTSDQVNGEGVFDYVPKFLMGYSGKNGSGNPTFLQPVPFRSTPLLLNNNEQSGGFENNAVQYQFLIPFSAIQGEGVTIKSFALINNKGEQCAIVTPGDGISLRSASSILVYWTLKFIEEA